MKLQDTKFTVSHPNTQVEICLNDVSNIWSQPLLFYLFLKIQGKNQK